MGGWVERGREGGSVKRRGEKRGGGQIDRRGQEGKKEGISLRHGLRADERASRVDVEHASPLLGGHVGGVRAADYTGEAAEDVDAAEVFGGGCHGGGDVVGRSDVDEFGEDGDLGEVLF